MKMLVVNRNSIVSILATVLVSISLFVVGCSETEDDIKDDTEAEVVVNSQPSLGAIPNQTVDMGAEVAVAVNIIDADVDNTHTISASSNDKAIATVSVKNTTLTISGVAGGLATITVSAVDDSGQGNATSTPVTFQVTVDANSQPSIGAIPDQTLEIGAEVTVVVNITDADVDNTHTISASSDDTAIATVAMKDITLTVIGIVEGLTTITVNVTDDSGKNNAAATPVSFQVTVNDPYTPFAGLTVSPGKVAFRAGGLLLQAGGCIVMGGTFNNVRYDTHSFKWQRRENPASPWIDIPGTEVEDGICGYRPDRPGQYRAVWDVSINGVRKKYASANILIVG